MPPRCANASAKRSSGTRSGTKRSSASGQRARSASRSLDRGEPVLPAGVDAAEEDAVLEDRVDAEHRPVDLDAAARADRSRAGRRRRCAAAGPALAPSAARCRPPRRRGRTGRGRRCRCPRSRRSARRSASTSSPVGSSDAVHTSTSASRSRYVVSIPIAPAADHERTLELPRLAAADRARVPQRPRADRRRLGEDAEAAEGLRDRDRAPPGPRRRARARSRAAA